MQQYFLLGIGLFLILASVSLIFLKREGAAPIIMLFFGVVVCLIPKAQTFGIKIPGFGGTITAQVPETMTDIRQKSGVYQGETGAI